MPQKMPEPLTQERPLFSAPTYERIEDDLRARIAANDWPAGGQIPSRKELAQEYRVSVPTVQRAIADLLADGVLSADRGRGTFVAVGAARNAILPLKPAARARPAAPRRRVVRPSAFSRPRTTATVGVISALPPEENPERNGAWPEIMTRALERAITADGGMTRFVNVWQPGNPHTVDISEAMAALQAEGVDALAVVMVGDADFLRLRPAQRAEIPVVFVGGAKSAPPAHSVYYDSRDAGYQAAEHLLDAGCADLLFFSPYTYSWVGDRLAGAREAVRRHGLPPGALHVAVDERDLHEVLDPIKDDPMAHMKAAHAAARLLLAGGLPAQGVIADNDAVALGFRQAAAEVGLTAGRDYALIGFDDLPGGRAAGLSTLHPPLEALGQEAGRLLLHALAGETTPMQVCLHSYLVARASSRLGR